VLAVCSERGECPLIDFLIGLRGQLQDQGVRMLALIKLVAEDGPPRNPSQINHIRGTPIYEFIRGDLRVFWFHDEGKVVVCSHGIVKRTQKTPAREIELAKRNHAEYMAAKRAGKLRLIEEQS
jgi:hypothetical protein